MLDQRHRRRWCTPLGSLCLLYALWYYIVVNMRDGTRGPAMDEAPLIKPLGIKVSGLVFFGRRDRVSCLRCYIEVSRTCRLPTAGTEAIQRNLVDHGGWLDEVLWVANTEDEDDLRLLDDIISSNPSRHKKLIIPGEKLWVYTYYKAWQHLERGKYYVKIDDDIVRQLPRICPTAANASYWQVWFHDDAIPKMVMRKILNPSEFVVSANVINNPPLGFLHYHFGAIHPYFPDLSHAETTADSWKPSHYPYWNGSTDFAWPLHNDPPHEQHRWLRVEEDTMLSQTPAAHLKYEVWGDSYKNWAIAAQMHYSLLENIEEDNLDLYTFDKPWRMDGERIRINFICLYSNDILDTNIDTWPRDRGDEDMIAIDLPKALRRRK